MGGVDGQSGNGSWSDRQGRSSGRNRLARSRNRGVELSAPRL